ncbi:hypothetical protein GJAV_G00059030 [Gymnothorax javanicus]|nr:hypothetical protein GJAV_G00059030 [Gymnothorax javanicus]
MAADGEQQRVHRAGIYKQKNKQHKHGKHRTKGEIERENKGRVSVVGLTKKQRREMKKIDRRHKANQLRRNKRDVVLSQKRSLGSRDGPPHLVVVVPLHDGVSVEAVTRLLRGEGVGGVVQEKGGVTGVPDSFGLLVPRFKRRFVFVNPGRVDFHSLLDWAKVADSLVFVLDSSVGWDSYGDHCLSCLFAQGLPSHVLACQGVSALPLKKQVEFKRALQRLTDTRFPAGGRIYTLDTEEEATLLLRCLGEQRQKRLKFRSRRAHLLAQRASYTPNLPSPTAGTGTLCVSGYVRGRPLQVNRLVHIAGHGDFQLSRVDASPDPLPLVFSAAAKRERGDMEMQDGDQEANGGPVRVLMEADPSLRETLQTEAEVDPMEGEQTWPTDSELREAEEARKNKKMMKVPKGTSSYQAAWILDEGEGDGDTGPESEEEEDDDDEDEDAVMEGMDEAEDSASQDAGSDYASEEEEEEEQEEVTSEGRGQAEQRYDKQMNDAEEEEEELRRYREARANDMFPDEVDTPIDTPARVRFQRYRGLKSFRSSPWDPLENLPPDYSRIFQFQNFERSRRRILNEASQQEDGAMVGWYVILHIEDVPPSVIESFQAGRPLVLVSLLPHEQKMSVMHMLVKRAPGSTEPIKSKQELVFHCGFRRFRASAIFSQHTSADKHKMERFLPAGAPSVVSVYAPITFPSAGVLLFAQSPAGTQELVATGSLLGCDPGRVILKRIVLSGHPFKINRRSAVVRYMFFNREDIQWFKPVELRTKWGRRGHIKEALGTHGHMKCVFEHQLGSQDTVLMNLYKRVYPRWSYDPYVPLPAARGEGEGTEEINME